MLLFKKCHFEDTVRVSIIKNIHKGIQKMIFRNINVERKGRNQRSRGNGSGSSIGNQAVKEER